jgi:hypothetical protein
MIGNSLTVLSTIRHTTLNIFEGPVPLTVTDNAGVEVLTAVAMKTSVFWDMSCKSTDISEEHFASIFGVKG